MKVPYLRTKSVAALSASALASVTIKPVAWVAEKISDQYNVYHTEIQVRYIKTHWAEFSVQEKFDAYVAFRGDLAWINDPIVDAAAALMHNVDRYGAQDRFESAYATLVTLGVKDFPARVINCHEANLEDVSNEV